MNKEGYVLARVKNTPLAGLLAGIFCAESLPQALAARSSLRAGQSVVTRSGSWLGASWVRIAGKQDASSGVLRRQRELEELAAQVASTEASLAANEQQRAQRVDKLQAAEQQRDNYQRELADQGSQLTGLADHYSTL